MKKKLICHADVFSFIDNFTKTIWLFEAIYVIEFGKEI